MKISVIIPVYNCAPYVERCIRSILAQTHGDLEIICVNDGSIDGSGAILDQLALEDERIYVIHQNNAGVSAARNAGIELASGELITFVDSDDAIEPDMYEALLDYFDNDQVDIVHCGYKRIRPDGTIKEINGTGRLVRQSTYEAAECLLSGRLFVGSLCNKLYRSHLFSQVRMDKTLAINEDVLANAELISHAKELVYLDVGKYLMYERTGSATSATKPSKIMSDCIHAAEKMLQVYRGTPAEPAAQLRLMNTQIGMYRWYIMENLASSHRERKELSREIEAIIKHRKDVSLRQHLNYFLMRNLPVIYKLTYSVYDRIRIPNWDVKE